MRRHDAIALAILALLITLVFADIWAGINSLYVRDLAFYYYPAKKVLRTIVLGGELPLWNPFFSGGQPMAANPEHEVFYPLTWLILLPSYDFGFRLLLLLHIYIAAFAMYALLRSMSLRAPASFIGALSFALGGIVLSNTGLLPILFSVAWMPLTLLYARRYLREGHRRDLALAALFLGIQLIIGEPTTAFQTGLLLLLLATRNPPLATRVAPIVLLALAISAVQVLPAIDHARDSVRARGFTFEDVTDWSMPVTRLADLVYPNALHHRYPGRERPFFYGIYAGLMLLVLTLAGIVTRARGAALVVIALALSILLALGNHTPLWRLLYDLGLARSVRYPEKFILLGVFVLIVFGTKMLDRLLDGDERLRKASLIIVAIITVIACIPLWKLAAARGLLLLLLLWKRPRAALIALFVVVDIGLVVPQLTPRIDSAYFRDPPAQNLPRDRDAFRILHYAARQVDLPQARPYFGPDRDDYYWVSRNALFPMMPAAVGLRMVLESDYDRTALLPSADFAAAMAALSRQRPDWMGVAASMSNVKYVAMLRNPRTASMEAGGDVRRIMPIRWVELEHHPRYYFAERIETIRDDADFVAKLAATDTKRAAFIRAPAFTPQRGTVREVRETFHTASIEVETAGRAFLVISVTPHKYWRVQVDGEEVQAIVTNVGYQGVVIPNAGRHVVTMRYRNPLIIVGAVISLLACLGAAAMLRRMKAAALPPHS